MKITAFYITLARSPLIGFVFKLQAFTVYDHKTYISLTWRKLNKILNGRDY